MLVDDRREYLYFKVAGGKKSHHENHPRAARAQNRRMVAQNGKPLLIEDVSKDPGFSSSIADDKSGFKTRSILCVPMIMHDEVIG